MPRISDFIELVRAGIPANVAISDDPHLRIRHESFIVRNFVIGVLSLAMVPVYLAVGSGANLAGVIALGLLSLLAPVALYLSKSGRLGPAHALQAGVVAAFVSWLMALSGGISSPAALWLAVLPFEPAITGTRRLVLINIVISALVFAAIGTAQLAGVVAAPALAEPAGKALAAIFSLALILYGFLLVLELEALNGETRNAARDREFLYQVIGNNVLDAVSLHDRSGAILYATPSIDEILKVASGDALGDGLFARVHVADRPAYLKAISDAIADRAATIVEFRARTGCDDAPEGRSATPEFVWLEMRCKPLDPAWGRPDRLVAVTRDVSHRKQHEEVMRLAREKAEEASDLKTRFLANVSHELRTPLNAILGFSELVQGQALGPVGNEKYLEYVRLIHDSGEHLLNVVNDILDMSKIEAGKFQVLPEPFAVAPVVKECVDMTMPQARASGVAVLTRIADDVGDMVADRRAVRQILLNLLSNAIKFTEPGGSVTVAVKRTRSRFLLSVSDTGIGMSREDLANLGKPFFQADSSYARQKEGTGLGLSVVKGLSELHGGEMRVTSALGAGTTVVVGFPIAPEAAEPVSLARPGEAVPKPVRAGCRLTA